LRFGLVRALPATLFLHPAVSNQASVDAAFLDMKRVMFGPSRGETVHQQASRSALERRNDVSVAAVLQDGGIRARSIK